MPKINKRNIQLTALKFERENGCRHRKLEVLRRDGKVNSREFNALYNAEEKWLHENGIEYNREHRAWVTAPRSRKTNFKQAKEFVEQLFGIRVNGPIQVLQDDRAGFYLDVGKLATKAPSEVLKELVSRAELKLMVPGQQWIPIEGRHKVTSHGYYHAEESEWKIMVDYFHSRSFHNCGYGKSITLRHTVYAGDDFQWTVELSDSSDHYISM